MNRFRKWWVIPLVLVLAGAGYLALRSYKTSQQQAVVENLQTETISRGTLTATIGAYGTSRSNQRVTVVWQTNGTVGKVNVKLGQMVQAGQELAALDPKLLPSNIVSAQQSLINAQTNLQNLLESRVPTGQTQQSLAQDQQNLINAQDQRAGLNGQTNASQDAINQAQANYDLAKIKVQKLQDRYKRTPGKPENSLLKATALSKLDQAIQQRDAELRILNWDKAHPSNVDIAKANAKVALAQDQLANDQYQYSKLKNGPTPNNIAAAKAAVASAQAIVDEAQITTPITGTITEVNVQPNDLVTPGQAAFRVDDLSSIYVDLQVSEVDITQVKVGQAVNLTFDALPNQQFTGKVTQIGLAGVSNQGVVDFQVTVRLNPPDNQIKPGMTAAGNIIVSQVPNALLVPIQAIQTINNQPVVFVLRGGKIQSVQVKLGAASTSMSQVVSGGLKAGDEVILNPPSSLLNSGNGFGRSPFGGGSSGQGGSSG